MPLSIREILQWDIMKEARVLTPDTSMDNVVEWVSVIEIPVENFVRPGELVLSTAVGCGKDPSLFTGFLRDLIQTGATALAVATGRHLMSIPEEAIQLAREQHIPLIELPWGIRFSYIIHKVLRALDHQQDQWTIYSKETQEELLQLILQGANLTSLASVIYRKLSYPALFANQQGEVCGSSPQTNRLAEHCTSLPKTKLHTRSQGDWAQYHTDKNCLVEIPIYSARKRQGSLWLQLPHTQASKPFLQKKDHIFLEHAATAAALCFLQASVAFETELRLRSDFLWNLAKGEIPSMEIAAPQAEALGYDLSLPYVCILGSPEISACTASSSTHPELSHVTEEIHITARMLSVQILTTLQLDQFVIYLHTEPTQVILRVQSFLDLLESRLHERFPNLPISWGIGENRAGVFSFREGYLAAHSALTMGRRQKGIGRRSFYMDTGLYRALDQLAEHPEIQEITNSTMHHLLDYSRKRGINLITTFNAYLRNQMNVSQTAREMNLHRQSLLYRLRKIESLTGRSLFNPDDLFLLQLSIKLWQSRGEVE
ncbi:purine catabolism regulatory protein [Marininema mesophilum]|uniref:Purine catabolism regulatory protein n=1 Tax=Marininema mesophilum TaxID=1048340 RepID=A0A1H2VA76_9BACL|nr:PucR family transcriptional regulator [Marininema mesophilum]SDW64814.1 purine catabolism regulatory protein [Marininema mesophilum]